MRPAVHASILRNRSQRVKRVMRPHSFSMRRLLLLAFVGAIFFIPGVVLTIVGLEKTEDEYKTMKQGQKIMYQAVGPIMTTMGLVVLFSSCVYYYCYGTGESNRGPGGSHQKKSFQSSINSDHSHHHHRGHGHGHHGHHGHHNGSQLNTPDGSVRRLSFKEDPHGTPQPSPLLQDTSEEQVPLAGGHHENGSSPRSPPPVSIRVERVPNDGGENEAQERERLVNGEVHCGETSPV